MITRAVFFDLFETLVSEGGTRPPAEIPEDVYRRVRRASRHAAMTGRIGYADILRNACREAGIDESIVPRLYARRLAEKAALLTNVEPRMFDLLREIRARQIKISVISNCSADETAGWSDAALSAVVDDTVFSHVVGLVKPDPAIYLLACTRLGVLPGESVFVGDGGGDELRGAAEVGMRVYQAGWYVTRATEYTTIRDPGDLLPLISR